MLDRCRQYGDLRLLEVTEERNGPSGLRDDDDSPPLNPAIVGLSAFRQHFLCRKLRPFRPERCHVSLSEENET